jgi:hypothetical protein
MMQCRIGGVEQAGEIAAAPGRWWLAPTPMAAVIGSGVAAGDALDGETRPEPFGYLKVPAELAASMTVNSTSGVIRLPDSAQRSRR